MSIFPERLRASLGVALTLAGVAIGLTSLYLGMRAVMDIGGACAEGGPFVPVRPCPEGAPLLIVGGIWGGIAFLGAYLWQTHKYQVPSLIGLAWPALFLSLGWNFLDYGLDPPGEGGVVWGWLFCAVIFFLMGGLPLLAVAGPTLRAFSTRASVPGPLDAVRQMKPQLPRRGSVAQPTPAESGVGGSGSYWFILQMGAIAGGVYLGAELFTALTT